MLIEKASRPWNRITRRVGFALRVAAAQQFCNCITRIIYAEKHFSDAWMMLYH